MNPFQIQADDVARLQAEMGTACPTLNWNNADWQIIPGSARQGRPLVIGGISMMFDFSADLIVAPFLSSDIPDVQTLVSTMLSSNRGFTYLGMSYKFDNVHILAGGFQIRIEANALNQNA